LYCSNRGGGQVVFVFLNSGVAGYVRKRPKINLREDPNSQNKTIIGNFYQDCKALQAEICKNPKKYQPDICLGSKFMLPFTHFLG
jgi:hypothetical protein